MPSAQSVHTIETFSYTLVLEADSTANLRIVVSQPLEVPSCLVYQLTDNAEWLLGKIEQRGEYNFPLKRFAVKVDLKIKDGIHNKVIRTFSVYADAGH